MKKDTMISVNFDSFKALSDEELARIIGLATCALSMRNTAVANPIQVASKKTHKVSEPDAVASNMYTLVFSFDKIADAKSFMEGQEQYRK